MTLQFPRVLYIAGYSRCGSTILDMILNGAAGVASTGELTYLHDDAANPQRQCTCGACYTDCPRYGPWLAGRPAHEGAFIRSAEARAGLRELLSNNIDPSAAEAYRDYAQSLFAHLKSQTGARTIIDSSKSAKDAAGRPLALLRLAGLDVRVLHLSRDPRATVGSYLNRGSNWVLEGHRTSKPLESWRPILGWTLANRIASRIGAALGPERYMHVRLEDILADPRPVLKKIGHFADLDLADVAERVLAGEAFQAGHNVGGNRTRLKPQRIELAARPAPPLPAAHALGLAMVSGRTQRKLGYV